MLIALKSHLSDSFSQFTAQLGLNKRLDSVDSLRGRGARLTGICAGNADDHPAFPRLIQPPVLLIAEIRVGVSGVDRQLGKFCVRVRHRLQFCLPSTESLNVGMAGNPERRTMEYDGCVIWC